ncbi:MAG: radical SAM protein, partial [Deltaproteobacteria bacterium]|nr:radical SAM protein [Deltaproteobacteria bacterium]
MNVTLFLTHQCNLRCDYCYNGEPSDRVMSDEVVRQGVKLAFSSPAADPDEPVLIRFFGGEPLLQLDLLKTAVAHARTLAASQAAGELCFSVTTNGTLLDQPTAAYLEQ